MRHFGIYSPAATPTVIDLVDACTPERREIIFPLIQILEDRGLEYLAARPHVHELQPHGFNGIRKKTLIDAYDYRTVAVKAMLATMQASLPAAHADLCPYCNLDTGAQLDHFLPKSKYPEFSLYGPNLLPICGVCNNIKLASITNGAGERLFLFLATELANNTRVLRAEVSFQGAPHTHYFIDDAGILLADELALVNRHFIKLKLPIRFSRRAHSLLAGLKLHLGGKSAQLSARVIEAGLIAAQAGEPINSWNRALYEALNDNIVDVLQWLA